MKALTLNELVKVLGAPENQPMGTLIDACKQAAQFIRNEKVIYEKGAEFAKLFSDKKFEAIDPAPKAEAPQGEAQTSTGEARPPIPAAKHIEGACNIYVTGIRPVKGNPAIPRVELLKALREASGDLNSAPRMTMQKANEMLGNLELGDQATFIRTLPQMEEAAEIVSDLLRVGLQAEIRN